MLPAIRAEVEAAEDSARPATAAEILMELELLESRYHRMDHDAGTAKALARQWVEDLQELGVPIGHLRDRCKAWRMSDSAFAPRSAGQLLGGKDGSWMASYAARLRGAMDRIESETPAEVLTREEVDARYAAERQERLRIEAEEEAQRLRRNAEAELVDARLEIRTTEESYNTAVERISDLTTLSKNDPTPKMATLYTASIKGAERARDEASAKMNVARKRLIKAQEALAAFDTAEEAA